MKCPVCNDVGMVRMLDIENPWEECPLCNPEAAKPINCAWYIRWWHRRKRRIDLEIMLPAIKRATNDDPKLVAECWEQFASSKGQEHWRCGCMYADAKLEKTA